MASKKSKGNDRDEADVSRNDLEDSLNEQELEELYAWVDKIPLSRPKKNIARDFSDGVLVAELLHHSFPKLVELHNYAGANATKNKLHNWEVLNRKVFSKMNFELAEDVINDVCCAKPGIIEKVLCMLRIKIERAKYAVHQNEKPEADQYQPSPGRGQKTIRVGTDVKGVKGRPNKTVEHIPLTKPQKMFRQVAESESVSRILFEETEQKLLAKDEMIKILEAKIHRLEHLLYLKDKRIDDLQARVEASRPTGIRR